MASAGFDAFIAHELDRVRSGHITHMSYIQPIWGALRRYKYPTMRVYLDDNPAPIDGVEVMVSNLPAYGMGLKVGHTAREDDGRFVVTVLQRGSAFQMIRYSIKLWRGTHDLAKDVQVVKARRVRIVSVEPGRGPVPFQVDGDPAGEVPVELECLPNALRVFVPGE
ncbi:MAG: hypothetical protein VX311_13850 [Planctomycetota bacterium]|nr:hypothetical protein [Planctomycetota bacterium]